MQRGVGIALGMVLGVCLVWLAVACAGPGGSVGAHKGAWVSSGGELFRDSNNPWFLRNTPDVNYCIQVDREGMSASPEKISALVIQALDYWKKQFTWPNMKDGMLGIGLQSFHKVECTGKEDLRFQFGAGTLTPDQVLYLKEPRDLIGIAVRTDYDEEQLRGRGFIFITSDQGPSAYHGDEQFLERPWRFDGLLFREIAHELGHVFGIPHVGEGLMSAQFPDHILRKNFCKNYLQTDYPGDFFIPFFQGIDNCNLSPEAAQWFSAPADSKCIHFAFKPVSATELDIEFSASPGAGGTRTNLGKVVVPLQNPDTIRFGYSRGVVVYLNSKQKVLGPNEMPGITFYPGPGFISMDYSGMFQNARGADKPIYLKMKASSHEILGERDGQIRSLLFYSRSCLVFSPNGSFVCLDP